MPTAMTWLASMAAANEALWWSRNKVMWLKSSNKVPSSDMPHYWEPIVGWGPTARKWRRWARAKEAILEFRGDPEAQEPLLDGTLAYTSADAVCAWAQKLLDRPWRDRAGLCGELAALAFKRLRKRVSEPVDIVTIATYHNFAVVGQTPNLTRLTVPDDSVWPRRELIAWSYPAKFEEWDKGAWICDPWANIACRARVYPAMWNMRMRRWSRAGKQIWEGAPMDPVLWEELPRMGDKLSMVASASMGITPPELRPGVMVRN